MGVRQVVFPNCGPECLKSCELGSDIRDWLRPDEIRKVGPGRFELTRARPMGVYT